MAAEWPLDMVDVYNEKAASLTHAEASSVASAVAGFAGDVVASISSSSTFEHLRNVLLSVADRVAIDTVSVVVKSKLPLSLIALLAELATTTTHHERVAGVCIVAAALLNNVVALRGIDDCTKKLACDFFRGEPGSSSAAATFVSCGMLRPAARVPAQHPLKLVRQWVEQPSSSGPGGSRGVRVSQFGLTPAMLCADVLGTLFMVVEMERGAPPPAVAETLAQLFSCPEVFRQMCHFVRCFDPLSLTSGTFALIALMPCRATLMTALREGGLLSDLEARVVGTKLAMSPGMHASMVDRVACYVDMCVHACFTTTEAAADAQVALVLLRLCLTVRQAQQAATNAGVRCAAAIATLLGAIAHAIPAPEAPGFARDAPPPAADQQRRLLLPLVRACLPDLLRQAAGIEKGGGGDVVAHTLQLALWTLAERPDQAAVEVLRAALLPSEPGTTPLLRLSEVLRSSPNERCRATAAALAAGLVGELARQQQRRGLRRRPPPGLAAVLAVAAQMRSPALEKTRHALLQFVQEELCARQNERAPPSPAELVALEMVVKDACTRLPELECRAEQGALARTAAVALHVLLLQQRGGGGGGEPRRPEVVVTDGMLRKLDDAAKKCNDVGLNAAVVGLAKAWGWCTGLRVCQACQWELLDPAKVCSGCRAVWYCGVQCRDLHWKLHRRFCRTVCKYGE